MSLSITANGQGEKKELWARTSAPFPEVIKTQTTEEKIISLRRAIKDFEKDHRKPYEGEKFLAELRQAETVNAPNQKSSTPAQLQKRALLANPALDSTTSSAPFVEDHGGIVRIEPLQAIALPTPVNKRPTMSASASSLKDNYPVSIVTWTFTST